VVFWTAAVTSAGGVPVAWSAAPQAMLTRAMNSRAAGGYRDLCAIALDDGDDAMQETMIRLLRGIGA
jgi:hypothetical protein